MNKRACKKNKMRNKESCEKKVTFSNLVNVFTYNSECRNEVDKCFSDAQRKEPNIIDKHYYKSKIIEIFHETMEKGILIVLGNLGRHPYILEYYLDVCFDSTKVVHIRSSWWKNINIDLNYRDDQSPCDMLIILEPLPYEINNQVINQVNYAKSILVLTSFQYYNPANYPTRSLYLGNNQNIMKILGRYKNVKNSNIYHFTPQLFYHFTPQLFCNYRIPFFNEPNVFMKISQYQSKNEIFLCILNMIDFISNLNIKSWTVKIE